jgi:hypothetical protein
MSAEHLVALVPFIHGHVRLLAGQVFPGGDRVVGQRDNRAVRLAIGGVPAHGQRLATRARSRPGRSARPAGQDRPQLVLGGFGQLDRCEPPAVADPQLTAQDHGDLAELRGCQRIQRMRRHPVTPS